MPAQLEHAMFVVTMCERFGCLPSALEKEDARLIGMVLMTDRERARKEAADHGE